MNIPNLPTDNLYKFIALTGVLLILIAIFYPEYKRNLIRDEITLYNGEVNKLNIESNKAKRKLKNIKEQVDRLDKKLNGNNNSIVNDTLIVRTRIIEGSKELVDLSAQIDKLIEEYLFINTEIELKSIEILVKSELIEFKNQDLIELDKYASIFGPFSLIFAYFGFFLWYEKTQKYQDRVLKEQSNQFLNSGLCQSCGMHLTNQDNYHLFSTEEKQSIYCKTCFKDGQFTEPELTISQMKEKVKARCKELGFNPIIRFIFQKRIKNLERWKNKFKW